MAYLRFFYNIYSLNHESNDGLSLRYWVYVKRNNKPVILIDAEIHAREWIAPAMALYIINQLVENPDNRHMVENVDWHIIPLLNPDGYEYSHLSNPLWRKTRSSGNSCMGVDGNRNFDFHWMEVGASHHECAENFGGLAAMSEPEVQTLAKVVKEVASRIKLYLTFHSYGKYILYPWGFTSALPGNADVLQSLGEKVAKAIRTVDDSGYTVGSSTNILYAAAGGSDDWVALNWCTLLSFLVVDLRVSICQQALLFQLKRKLSKELRTTITTRFMK